LKAINIIVEVRELCTDSLTTVALVVHYYIRHLSWAGISLPHGVTNISTFIAPTTYQRPHHSETALTAYPTEIYAKSSVGAFNSHIVSSWFMLVGFLENIYLSQPT
jgi:hypothetical protein